LTDEDHPEKPSYSKFGLLLLLLTGVIMIYTLSPYIFPEEVLVDDPERDYDIIVRFIGNVRQIITYT